MKKNGSEMHFDSGRNPYKLYAGQTTTVSRTIYNTFLFNKSYGKAFSVGASLIHILVQHAQEEQLWCTRYYYKGDKFICSIIWNAGQKLVLQSR